MPISLSLPGEERPSAFRVQGLSMDSRTALEPAVLGGNPSAAETGTPTRSHPSIGASATARAGGTPISAPQNERVRGEGRTQSVAGLLAGERGLPGGEGHSAVW